jgi:hypothetical protein
MTNELINKIAEAIKDVAKSEHFVVDFLNHIVLPRSLNHCNEGVIKLDLCTDRGPLRLEVGFRFDGIVPSDKLQVIK